jgi:hypothetical protein
LLSDTILDASDDASAAHHLHQQQQQLHQQSAGGGSSGSGGDGPGVVKQEDMQSTLSLVARRPRTSSGYEGETDLLY